MMVPESKDAILVVGSYTGPTGRLEEERAAIFRVNEREAKETYKSPCGWISTIGVKGQTALAILNILGEKDRREEVLLSHDQGQTWINQGRIDPVHQKGGYISVVSIVVEDSATFWLRGHGPFLKSTDEGKSWKELESPLPFDAAGVDLPMVSNQVDDLILGGAGLARTRDGGRNWKTLSSDSTSVTDGLYVAHREYGKLRVGVISEKGIYWMSAIEGPYLASNISSQGGMVLLSVTRSQKTGKRLAIFGNDVELLASPDHGRTFLSKSVRVSSSDQLITTPYGSVWKVDIGRRVYRSAVRIVGMKKAAGSGNRLPPHTSREQDECLFALQDEPQTYCVWKIAKGEKRSKTGDLVARVTTDFKSGELEIVDDVYKDILHDLFECSHWEFVAVDTEDDPRIDSDYGVELKPWQPEALKYAQSQLPRSGLIMSHGEQPTTLPLLPLETSTNKKKEVLKEERVVRAKGGVVRAKGVGLAAFRQGRNVYYRYDWENVAFRWNHISHKTFGKFRGKSEFEVQRGSELDFEARLYGVEITKEEYENF